ncbi:hypothetical protein GOODEAATRI_007827 [Goodea atripinnis]|uniref:Uncharacterized protein n=1 Tax=Goodea atripinnis TaxID=208336 RepID=A0ABV0N8U0_9TELE
MSHLPSHFILHSKHKPFPSATLPKPSGLLTCNSKLLLNGLIKKFKHDRSLAITPRENSRRHKIIIEKYSNHYGIKIPVCQHCWVSHQLAVQPNRCNVDCDTFSFKLTTFFLIFYWIYKGLAKMEHHPENVTICLITVSYCASCTSRLIFCHHSYCLPPH